MLKLKKNCKQFFRRGIIPETKINVLPSFLCVEKNTIKNPFEVLQRNVEMNILLLFEVQRQS